MRVRAKSNFENFRMPNRLFKDLLKSKLKPLPLLFVTLLIKKCAKQVYTDICYGQMSTQYLI